MLKINIAGYVNSVRTNTLSSGKKVTNVKVGVTLDKVNKKYQSFDVAFWEDYADNAAKLKDKEYIYLPDVVIKEIKSTPDGKYTNISALGSVVFTGINRDTTSTVHSAQEELSDDERKDFVLAGEAPKKVESLPF